ncbi:glycosyltransferase family 2 protein [Pseudomarimonas arenosa]|uniref:Glycosyltransferase family 2 protein n=1 Tax=Pseudomarimonas arenosa TaxID=2774145 RepID=A0AAW3ZFK7_9GAMM|nr:glycosyltransferase family 2 protein [Pseudomarimonas arenosa]MBD8524893.1 glycosyltransferase family 2 protein [Pseudomarimonas arenosa]
MAVIVVNFNTSADTLECLASLQQQGLGFLTVAVVDNASTEEQRRILRDGISKLDLPSELIENGSNLGFAAAVDVQIRRLLANSEVMRIFLFNNDAVALPALAHWLQDHAAGDLCAARVMKYADPQRVDSLGIVMYRSMLASNRLSVEEPLLGPTGGCAVYSRRLLCELQRIYGYTFDHRFFCYAEDTDVALRAVLLGFEPDYFDGAVALHKGQASSGGGFSDFVLYHGIRNSIWLLLKSLPGRLLLLSLAHIALLHLGVVVRHTLRGKFSVVVRLYRDALSGARTFWRERVLLAQIGDRGHKALQRCIDPKFYDRGYVRQAVKGLFNREA